MPRKQSRIQPRHQAYSDRKTDVRDPLPLVLIVCEGSKTEPNYFKCFRAPTVRIKVLGLGDNTLSLVEKTIELKDKGTYEYVWCVFDRDSFPPGRFNAAITSARNHNIYVAYSNESFELWFLLHFNFYDTAMARKDYKGFLTQNLGYEYEKKCEDMYEALKDNQSQAIKHAEKLMKSYKLHNPESDNPSTTVHLLVRQLNALVNRSVDECEVPEMDELLNIVTT